MIAACDAQDFVPYGREYSNHHPGTFQLQVQNDSIHADHGLPMLKSFRDISIQDSTKKENWQFRERNADEDNEEEEELYFSGNTVVWSQGGQPGARSTIKTFTMNSPIVQAHWCRFILPTSECPDEGWSSLDVAGEVQQGVCVVEAGTISCFLDKGGEYVASLPFQVSNVWPMKNGLLFERTVSPSEASGTKRSAPNQTTVFSMLHPLDEVAPVITKTAGSKLSYLTDNTQHIVFTSTEPSILMTYDTMVGIHTAWRVRRARPDECCAVCSQWENGSFCPAVAVTPYTGINYSSSNQSRLLSSLSAHSPCISPRRSMSGRISSPAFLSKSQSPALNMATISRSSPSLATASSLPRFLSYSPSVGRSPGSFFRTPPPSSSHNVSLINESFSEWVEPIMPEVCFEHLWTEPAPAIRDGSLGKASKAFLTKDLCGQQYLCYVISYRQQLRCVKFEESNDMTQLIFGAVAVIPAKDAVPVHSQDLLIILDPAGCLTIYTGTTKINRLHVPTLPLGCGSLSMLRAVTPLNSPTRGGIFTSSRPSSAVDARFDEALNTISPVPTEMEDCASFDESAYHSSFIQGIRDCVGKKFTIELLNGHLCRASMPLFCSSPEIELSLKALKHMLPRDLAIQILGRWFTVRNTPGGLGNQLEWKLFVTCLLSLLGYDTTRLALTSESDLDTSMSPVIAAKRQRPSDQGSDDDWELLLNSCHHQFVCDSLEPVMGLSHCQTIPDYSSYSRPCSINTSAAVFTHLPSVFLALHLVYEEMKLNTLLMKQVGNLAALLLRLSSDLCCKQYFDYYSRDNPQLLENFDDTSQIREDHLKKMQYPLVFTFAPLSVYTWLYRSFRGQDCPAFIYIPNVCNNIKNIISLYALMLNEDLLPDQAVEKCLKKLSPAGHRAPTCDITVSSFTTPNVAISGAERIVLHMTELGITRRDLENFPIGISLPLLEILFHCRSRPASDWPEDAYALIGRQDLSRLMGSTDTKSSSSRGYQSPTSNSCKTSKDEEDGMECLDEELLKLRFSEDLRVNEVQRLLQSSKPSRIALVQKPEVSDHEFIEEQERHLYFICIRTMALPVGRGMFTLSTFHPLPTEALPIPKLCLTGRAPPRNATVDLTHIDTPPNMNAWPCFHNGVAAGLRIANSSQIDSTWILYNKPKSNELTNEYAGFLMALGLNGHLVRLHTLNVHDYLTKGHEMTTIGLLLGLAAAKRGSMDLATTKVLSIHVPAFLPPTSTELNVPHNVQVAAVLGIGLVYQGTGHRHTAEVLLSEIGRPPGPEMENCSDRESYSLAAGLSFGLVMFQKGGESVGTNDFSLADTLCHFMVGGHKRPLTGMNKERYKTPSYQIQEGDSVNVDVTAPGATMALGMLYFNTGNSAVSEWLKAPDTQYMLDHIRPDFLLLRTLSRGLVNWEVVLPTYQWIESNLPMIVKTYAFSTNLDIAATANIDLETMSQAYCNILAGACMVVGLKFAGTANAEAYSALKRCMKFSLEVLSTASFVEQAGKTTVETCMITILMSLAMVMAGTGNLEVLAMCRNLRSRVGPPYNLYVMYGSHMAIGTATGLLFMGGGRYSLSTTPEAIAVMLCAFFPKFPNHSNDNRYHLQAVRHLYVLAAEARVILPRDVDTNQACYVPLKIKFKDTDLYTGMEYRVSAPCMLPQLNIIEEVDVLGPRYWPMNFHLDRNWNALKDVLKTNGTLFVKQRAGNLSYVEDPKGYRSMLAKSLTSDHSSHHTFEDDVLKAFTSDPKILALMTYFLNSKDEQNYAILQSLSSIVYDCITQEKPEAIFVHLGLYEILCSPEIHIPSLWQLKLVLSFYKSRYCLDKFGDRKTLLKLEFLLALKNRLEGLLSKWQKENLESLLKYVIGEPLEIDKSSHLSAYLAWFDIPASGELSDIANGGNLSLPVLCRKLPHLPVAALLKIQAILQSVR